MTREELLKELQDRGLSDDEIKALLKETLDTLDKDFADHDEKVDGEEKDKAAELLGVEL